jgi:hypothetical protein
MDMELWYDGTERGKPKYLEKLCQYNVVHDKSYVD